MQRKSDRFGAGLGKSTGWILKARLRQARVVMEGGVSYTRITDEGLHYTAGGEAVILAADSIVLCAGQESERSLAAAVSSRAALAEQATWNSHPSFSRDAGLRSESVA